jgi:lipoprotein-anchoring transpeptidase ErfK/SrfK
MNKYLVLGILSSLVYLISKPTVVNAYYDEYEGFGSDDYDDDHLYYSPARNQKWTPYKEREMTHKAPRLPSKIAGGNVIKVDLAQRVWGAYDHQGNLIKWGRASGGKKYCPDIRRGCRTITGTYTIYSKKGPSCKSSRFPVGRGGAPMPYCMHFHGGYALHGGHVPNYNASHGCIRLHYEDAQWLNLNFVTIGRTRVSIHY